MWELYLINVIVRIMYCIEDYIYYISIYYYLIINYDNYGLWIMDYIWCDVSLMVGVTHF